MQLLFVEYSTPSGTHVQQICTNHAFHFPACGEVELSAKHPDLESIKYLGHPGIHFLLTLFQVFVSTLDGVFVDDFDQV